MLHIEFIFLRELKYNFMSFFLDLRKKISSLYCISLFFLYIILKK